MFSSTTSKNDFARLCLHSNQPIPRTTGKSDYFIGRIICRSISRKPRSTTAAHKMNHSPQTQALVKFVHHSFEQDEQWKQYLSNLTFTEQTPNAKLLTKFKLKYFAKNVDANCPDASTVLDTPYRLSVVHPVGDHTATLIFLRKLFPLCVSCAFVVGPLLLLRTSCVIPWMSSHLLFLLLFLTLTNFCYHIFPPCVMCVGCNYENNRSPIRQMDWATVVMVVGCRRGSP